MDSLAEPSVNEALMIDDEHCLIRLASTYNWDLLLERCKDIAKIITSSVNRELVAVVEKQLKTVDDWGNTVLHIACFNSAPSPVVKSLLNASNNATPPIRLCEYQSLDGSTPLLVACATGSSVDVIQALLNAARDSTSHDGCLATVGDSQGNSPLSELCIQYELCRRSPMYHDDTPALHEINLLTGRGPPLFESFWQKVEAIIEAGWRHRNSGTHYAKGAEKDRKVPCVGMQERLPSILHGCANIADSCPPILSSLVCRSYPRDSSLCDKRGFLPLHVALGPGSRENQRRTSAKQSQNQATLIENLLQLFPLAAKKSVPGTLRSPFCHAIASGLLWHSTSITDSQQDKPGPIQLVWRCEPSALQSQDVVTGLYPFQLAASTPSSDSDSISHLDTVFCLLRLHPQLLSNLSYQI